MSIATHINSSKYFCVTLHHLCRISASHIVHWDCQAVVMASSTTVQGVTTVYTIRPILGPLTTVFTPPPECTFAAVRSTPLSIGFRAQTCVGDTLADESSRWPEATAAAPSPTPPFHGWGFYSPGIVCPAGHTTACDATQGQRTGWDMQYALEQGETVVGCCPTYVLTTSSVSEKSSVRLIRI